jgi:coatomer subunit gamma
LQELKVNENEVFIVISCLSKDIQQSDNDMVKANALRVLTKIIDEQYVQSLDRFLKQALLSRSDHNVSAALVSMIELFKKGRQAIEVVKRSVTELQEKLMSAKDGYVQYQALLILFELKKNDQMSCLKLLFQLAQS